MYGRTEGRAAVGIVVLALVAALGCGARPLPLAEEPPPPADAGQEFDPASAGAVAGRVIWEGKVPSAQPLVERPGLVKSGFIDEQTHWPNPNAPAINRETGAVRGAVVFLRGIDPRRGRPWDLPPVRVVQEGRRLHVRQGGVDGAVGFVHRGDELDMVAEDAAFYSLHAGGADFFTLPFPDARTRRRRLCEPGVVELTSAAGAFWMRGYLFVDDHPYYTRTDAEGRYRLPQVPPGRYEVVCWLPDWCAERHERDPETGLVTRVYFQPPLQWGFPVEVAPRAEAVVNFGPAVP